MSVRLVEEVASHAPEGLTAAERLVLVMLADAVHGKAHKQTGTRQWSLTHAELGRRCGMDVETLRKVLQRLAKPTRNRPAVDVRVPIGKDRHGRLLYAVPGVAPQFRVPRWTPPPNCGCWVCRDDSDEPVPYPTGTPSLKIVRSTA